MEQEQEKKPIIFGLYPTATLVNGIILIIISALVWSIVFGSTLTANTTLEDALAMKDTVPWYYDIFFVVTGMLMIFCWIEYKFGIEPGKLDWKGFKYKFLLGIPAIMIIEFTSKAIFLSIILQYK